MKKTGKGKTVIPKADEVYKSEILKQFNEDLHKATKKKVDIIKGAPYYFKPAFLLDSLTPFLKVEVQIYNYENNNYDYIDLFSGDLYPIKNNLKSFSYSIGGSGQESNMITIEMVDIDEDIIEMLLLRIHALRTETNGNIYLNIEYGWSAPDNLKEGYGKDVFFTRTMLTFFQDMKTSYTADGQLVATMTATVSKILPQPYTSLTPSIVLGTQPGITFAVIYALDILNTVFKNLFKSRQASRKQEIMKGLKQVARWLHSDLLLKDRDAIKKVLKRIVLYYNGSENNELTKYINKTFNNNFFQRSDYYKRSKYYNSTNTTYISSLSSGITLGSTLQKMQKDHSIGEKNVSINDDDLISKILNHSHPYKTLFEIISDDRGSEDNNAGRLRFLIRALSTLLADMYIHPYFIYEWTKTIFKKTIKDFNRIVPSELELNILNINLGYTLNQILPSGYLEKELSKSTTTSLASINKKTMEKYMHTAKDYVCGQDIDWESYFKSVTSKMYINYEISDAHQAQLIAKNNETSVQKIQSKKKGEMPSYRIPARIQLNTFMAQPKNADLNLQKYAKILEFKKSTLQTNSTTANNTEISKINTLLEQIKKGRKSINDSVVFFILEDIIDSSGFFNETLGNQQILQAYSFRLAGSPKLSEGNINPGYPTVWDIDFPDVISFEPEVDYLHNLQNFTLNNKSKIKFNDGSMTRKEIEDEKAREKKMQDKIDKNKSIEQLATEKEKLENAKNKVDINSFARKKSVSFNTNFNQRLTTSDSTGEALAAKKIMQSIRKKLMLNSCDLKAKMKILGDASFLTQDMNKFIFLKFYRRNGELAMFTGVYSVEGITHEISSGKFETSFDLRKIIQDVDSAEQLYDAVYNQDQFDVIVR